MDLREVDALIARHVFGLDVQRDQYTSAPIWEPRVKSRDDPWEYYLGKSNDKVARYTSDIAAAWRVVEHFPPLHFRLEQRGTVGTNWWARLYAADSERGHAEAPTAPLAICLAALRAKGIAPPSPTP